MVHLVVLAVPVEVVFAKVIRTAAVALRAVLVRVAVTRQAMGMRILFVTATATPAHNRGKPGMVPLVSAKAVACRRVEMMESHADLANVVVSNQDGNNLILLMAGAQL